MNPFIEGRNAGISMIPVKKGSKIPAVAWKDFQVEICTELQATEWGSNGHSYGVGVVTGEVSGRLMAVDIEAGFVPLIAELAERMEAAGLKETFDSWVAGYCESTPRGGLHVLVRLEGEGECPHNQQFAFDVDGKVLIETRGEGGYVLVAPTPGYQWRGKCSYSTIVYCTLEEWSRVEAVLRTFDTSLQKEVAPPPALTVPTRSTVGFDSILRLEGDSWVEAALAELPPMESVISGYGYVQVGVDKFGTLWVRPGKDPREGHSCRVNVNGRLMMFSSSTPLPASQKTTYDVVDVVFCYTHGHLPSKEERVDWLQAQRPPAVRGVGAAGTVPVAVPNLSPAVCIEDWFWEARPLFRQIRDTAFERGLSPDGVFGAWLSGYAATIPMGIWVAGPPTRAPLNMFCVLVGNPGTGKTASMRVASDLLGWNVHNNPHVLLGRPLRSGEGLVKLATIPAKKGDDLDSPSYRNAVQVAFDEGSVLGKQSDRTGSSTIPVLNSAWSGDAIIGGALSREVLEFPANLVRICVVMGVQYGAAANLFTGDAHRQGFPQRFLYFGLKHPAQADADVDGQVSGPARPLDLPFWPHHEYSGHPFELEYPADIERDIRLWTRNKDHGDGLTDDYDAHQMNQTKRIGAILTLADSRSSPSEQDWGLAAHVYDTSRKIRDQLRAGLKGVDIERQRARITEAVRIQDALEGRSVERQATRIARYIHTTNNDCTLKDIKSRLNPTERTHRDDYIAYALQMNWITRGDDDHFHPGPSQPA